MRYWTSLIFPGYMRLRSEFGVTQASQACEYVSMSLKTFTAGRMPADLVDATMTGGIRSAARSKTQEIRQKSRITQVGSFAQFGSGQPIPAKGRGSRRVEAAGSSLCYHSYAAVA